MTNAISSLEFTLLDGRKEALKPPAKEFSYSFKSLMPDDMGECENQMFGTNIGFTLWRSLYRFNPQHRDGLFSLYRDARGALTEPALIIQTSQGGNSHLSALSAGQTQVSGQGMDFFGFLEDGDYNAFVSRSAQVENTWLIITPTQLKLLIGERLAPSLMKGLRFRGTQSTQTFPMPRNISLALHHAMSSVFRDDMRMLHVQARTLGYLSLLAEHITGETPNLGSPVKTSKIRQLRDELESLEGAPPPLSELAERYGMSVRTLSDSFKQAYGCTIGAFVNEKRLDAAHTALRETDLAMKVIAARTGYAHVNNFITAFKRRFGFAPGALRR